MTNDLAQVGWSIELAKRTMKIVRQNLFWAFAYNIVGIALAAAGWLNPMWAAVAMVGSSLFVISNSLRLSNSASLSSSEGLEQKPTETTKKMDVVTSVSFRPPVPEHS